MRSLARLRRFSGVARQVLLIGCHGALTHDFPCRLVTAQTLERWMPKRPVFGPFSERYFGDELRLDPVRAPRFGTSGRIVKWRFFLYERLQLFVDVRKCCGVES